MNFEKLERNLIEVMEEQQAKLGFDGGVVWLFYPMASLNALLDTALDEEAMMQALQAFNTYALGRLGKMEIMCRDGRFSLGISPEGGRYVQQHMDESKFIVRFIREISRHGSTMDELLSLFREYSDCVHFERMENQQEFDYLVYFENGEPDSFYYCIKEDLGHMTYHRFTREDYHDFGF